MKKSEFLSLIETFMLNNDGAAISYWNRNDAPYDFNVIDKLMCSQINESIDYNNIIILHPSVIGGFPYLFGSKKYIADHISNLVDTKHILNSKGIKFKNGESLLNDKYSQSFFSIIIVKDGVAYVSTKTSNPFKRSVTICTNEKFRNIHINDDDLKNINLDHLNVMFSGFFKENHKINNL